MKTPRELILGRHQTAEARLKAICAEELAACARSAGRATGPRQPAPGLASAVADFWQETFWPWRRAWLGLAALWVCVVAFNLASRETPHTAAARPPQPNPEVFAVLQEQKELLTQLLGLGAPPLVSQPPPRGPRSAAEPAPAKTEGAGSPEPTLRPERVALA